MKGLLWDSIVLGYGMFDLVYIGRSNNKLRISPLLWQLVTVKKNSMRNSDVVVFNYYS